MEFENCKEDQSMQRSPLFEANGFIYWENRFETYVKSNDIDIWNIIVDGNYVSVVENISTDKDDGVSYERQKDEQKKKPSKSKKEKMVLVPYPKRNTKKS